MSRKTKNKTGGHSEHKEKETYEGGKEREEREEKTYIKRNKS